MLPCVCDLIRSSLNAGSSIIDIHYDSNNMNYYVKDDSESKKMHFLDFCNRNMDEICEWDSSMRKLSIKPDMVEKSRRLKKDIDLLCKFIRTISLCFPNVIFALYIKKNSEPYLHLPKTVSFEERWISIVGDIPRIDADGYFTSDVSHGISMLFPFIVDKCPANNVKDNNGEIKKNDKRVLIINQAIISVKWNLDGPEIFAERLCLEI